MKISDIYWLHEPILHDIEFFKVGHLLGNGENRIVPILTRDELKTAQENSEISGVILSSRVIEPENSKKIAIISHDPLTVALQIRDGTEKKHPVTPTRIHPTAQIHPTAEIADTDVIIGKNVRIKEHVRVRQGCCIGNRTVIGPNCDIGMVSSDYSIKPSGRVIIGKEVSIHALCRIEGPVFSDNTIIGDRIHIDNRVFIHQGVVVGERSLITANTEIEEYAHIGCDCWIGLRTRVRQGISIGKNCYVTLGSTISKNIDDNMVVRDNWAISRRRFRGIIP